jgi:hypothetical protein
VYVCVYVCKCVCITYENLRLGLTLVTSWGTTELRQMSEESKDVNDFLLILLFYKFKSNKAL